MRLLLLIALILTFLSCSETPNNEQYHESASTEIFPKYTEEEKRSIIENMQKAMPDFSNENEVRDLADAKFQLQRLGLAWYQCYGQLVAAKADSSVWKIKDTATSALSAYQKKMFPKYRKALVDETDKKLWIEDCSAFITGDDKEVLNLVGAAFAPNRCKQESYETLLDILQQYCFKNFVSKF